MYSEVVDAQSHVSFIVISAIYSGYSMWLNETTFLPDPRVQDITVHLLWLKIMK